MAWVAHDIGLLPGGNFSIAQACSADGSVIVGVADTGDFNGHAFRWTAGGGMVDLGLLSGGSASIAYGVSGDGTIVVGQSDGGSAPPGSTEAYRWTSGGGMVGLGYLGTGNSSTAWGISPDGTVIVGTSTVIPGDPFVLPSHPFRWTAGGGMVDLGLLSGNTNGIGQAASDLGTTVIGGSGDPADVPWRWTSGTGVVALPLAGGEANGAGLALSTDGLTATGFSTDGISSREHPFLWTLAGGSDLIGLPGGMDTATGNGISGDGTAIVGEAGSFPSLNNAFYWTDGGGFVLLPPPGGGSATHAHAISSNGSTVVGSAVVTGAQHAVYWRQEGSTVPLRRILTFAVSPLLYLIPNGPADSPPVPYNWMAATSDIPATASAVLHDSDELLQLNGMQLRYLQQRQYIEANYGAAVTSNNAETQLPPTAAASWNAMFATSGVRWDSGTVYGLSGRVAYPSTVAAGPLSSVADVLSFPDGTAQYSPQPVMWQGDQFMILYARALPEAEPQMLLGDGVGTIGWQTIWSGGSVAGGNNAPLWYPDQGDGFNFVLQGGVPDTNVRPTLGLIPSDALGAETFTELTLDDETYDAAFLEAAAAVGPDTQFGQTQPGGWLLPTDDGYFIFLAFDAAFYDIYQFTGADPVAQTILTNAAGMFRTTNTRMHLTRELVPFAIVPPGVAQINAPDVTVLSYPPPDRAPGAGGTLCGWRGLSGINWHGMALVGDKFSNVVGLSDFSVFQEYGNGMRWLITSPPVHHDRKRIFVPRFEIEVEAGLGLPDNPAAAPLMVLEVSKNGGKTFLPLKKARSMGEVGEYMKRLRWVQLGNARQWVFRLTYSDSARPALIGTYIDSIPGLG